MSKSAKVEGKKPSKANDSPALNTRSRRRATIASSSFTNGKFWNSNMTTPKRSYSDRLQDTVRMVDTPTPVHQQPTMAKPQKHSLLEKKPPIRKSQGTSGERTRNGTPYVKTNQRSLADKSSKSTLSERSSHLELPFHNETKQSNANKSAAYLTMRADTTAKVFESSSSEDEGMEKWVQPQSQKSVLDESFRAGSSEEELMKKLSHLDEILAQNGDKLSAEEPSDAENCIILERNDRWEPKEEPKMVSHNEIVFTNADFEVVEPTKKNKALEISSVTVETAIPADSSLELKTANSSQSPAAPKTASTPFSVLETSPSSSVGIQTPANSLKTANSSAEMPTPSVVLKASASPMSTLQLSAKSMELETANSSTGSQHPIDSSILPTVLNSAEETPSKSMGKESLDLQFAQMENRLTNMVELIGRMEQRQNEMTARLIQLHIDQRDLHRQQSGRLVDALEMIVEAIGERESRFSSRLQRFVDARLNAQSAVPLADSTTLLRDALRPLVGTLRAELERHLADVVSATLADAMADIVATMTALMRDRASPPPTAVSHQPSQRSPIEDCGVDASPVNVKTAVISAVQPVETKQPAKKAESPLSMQEKIQKIYATSSTLMRSYSPLLGKATAQTSLSGKPKAPCTLAQPTTSAAAAAADRLSSFYYAAETAKSNDAK